MTTKTLRSLLLGCFMAFAILVSAQTTYQIYPVPQRLTLLGGSCTFTPTVNVVAESGIDQATRARLTQVLDEHGLKATFSKKEAKNTSNILLGINGSRQSVDKLAKAWGLSRDVFMKQGKFDRHLLRLMTAADGQTRLVILGEHTNAVFFALASLEQMFDRSTRQ